MISSGELFLLNSETAGEFVPLPAFLNQNVRVISASLGRAYVATEPAVCPKGLPKRPCTVWCFEGSSSEPRPCPEFDTIEDSIKQIAIGEKHLLVLTHTGDVFSRGEAVYGNTGHGGANHVPEFKPVPALKGRNVKYVAAGPFFSIAITLEGDVFSWGQAFSGETGLFSKVDTVPRFAPSVTPFRVTTVSCGHAHVLACTEMQQCISWGENISGQLGIGEKTKPTYKPRVLESIPSQVQAVSAGWAHSVAVGVDGRAYTWGLNSHGQLGLGDTATRFSPHLIHALAGVQKVDSAHAARVSTLFHVGGNSKPHFCGRIPSGANGDSAVGAPRRPGESDPPGCLLCPVPLTLASAMGADSSQSALSHLAAFDRGAIGFARSSVYRISPSLAPVQGGTQVQANVTGLPFERAGRLSELRETRLIQEMIPVKVRLRSSSPLLDVVVPGRIVEADTVEFITPDVTLSPLGSVAEQIGCAPVQLQVSIDDGLTWTMENGADSTNLARTEQPNKLTRKKSERQVVQGLEELKGEFQAAAQISMAKVNQAMQLWYCRWPRGGPTHIEPSCSPVTGGTELLLHIQLPPRIPTDHVTVKFVCKPLYSVGDPELEGKAPMRKDAAEIVNPDYDEVAKLPLAGPLEVLACGWLDPGGRGVRCISPPLDAENVKFFDYSMELSLDGRRFLARGLPFNVYDLRVTGLVPCVGPLQEPTEVRIQTTGLVKTDIQKVGIEFPKDVGLIPRQLPARYDHTTNEIVFKMPELSAEVRRGIDRLQAEKAAAGDTPDSEVAGDGVAGDGEAVDPNGGLAGLEVFVELSLNGQNFTEDRVHFSYHGTIEPQSVRVIAQPEGWVEPAKEDPKAKGKKGAEEVDYPAVAPGAKLACEVRGLMPVDTVMLRAELLTKVGEEEAKPFRVVDMPGSIEMVNPLPPSTGAEEDGKKGKGKEAAAEPEELLPPIDMIVAYTPIVRSEDLPKEAVLYMQNVSASLNGQFFVPVADPIMWRLEPKPPDPVPEAPPA